MMSRVSCPTLGRVKLEMVCKNEGTPVPTSESLSDVSIPIMLNNPGLFRSVRQLMTLFSCVVGLLQFHDSKLDEHMRMHRPTTPASNPFLGLETEHLQTKYFKENLGYIVG